MSAAYAIASAPEAQALTGVWTPARAPSSMPTAAAGPLGMSIGTVSGKTRRGPFSFNVSYADSRVHTPPMPVAMTTPSRSGSSSGRPASAQASREAARAYCPEGSSRRVSTRASCSDGSTATDAAKVTGRSISVTQSWVRVRAPERPARAASQVVGTSPPMGVVAPRPVTTMRGLVDAMGRFAPWGRSGGDAAVGWCAGGAEDAGRPVGAGRAGRTSPAGDRGCAQPCACWM